MRLAGSHRSSDGFRDAKISNLHCSGIAQDNVLGLDVTVQHTMLMCILECASYLNAISDSLAFRDSALGLKKLA